jgi:Xaa-Pro aminopeptidase
MIVGRPSSEQEKFFKLMLEAREIAFRNIKAGTKTSDVDKAVRKFLKKKIL